MTTAFIQTFSEFLVDAKTGGDVDDFLEGSSVLSDEDAIALLKQICDYVTNHRQYANPFDVRTDTYCPLMVECMKRQTTACMKYLIEERKIRSPHILGKVLWNTCGPNGIGTTLANMEYLIGKGANVDHPLRFANQLSEKPVKSVKSVKHLQLRPLDYLLSRCMFFDSKHDSISEMALLLIKNGANVSNMFPVRLRGYRDLRFAKALIDAGININRIVTEHTSNQAPTALLDAIDNCDHKLVKLLLDNGADVNLPLKSAAFNRLMENNRIVYFPFRRRDEKIAKCFRLILAHKQTDVRLSDMLQKGWWNLPPCVLMVLLDYVHDKVFVPILAAVDYQESPTLNLLCVDVVEDMLSELMESVVSVICRD